MSLTDFRVVRENHEFRAQDGTLIVCNDDRQRVIAVVSRLALDDYFDWQSSTEIRRDSAVDGNLRTFERIVAEKYARGEHEPWHGYGSTLPLIRIGLADIKACGESLIEPPDIEQMAGYAGAWR
jgi:hypothetical protein